MCACLQKWLDASPRQVASPKARQAPLSSHRGPCTSPSCLSEPLPRTAPRTCSRWMTAMSVRVCATSGELGPEVASQMARARSYSGSAAPMLPRCRGRQAGGQWEGCAFHENKSEAQLRSLRLTPVWQQAAHWHRRARETLWKPQTTAPGCCPEQTSHQRQRLTWLCSMARLQMASATSGWLAPSCASRARTSASYGAGSASGPGGARGCCGCCCGDGCAAAAPACWRGAAVVAAAPDDAACCVALAAAGCRPAPAAAGAGLRAGAAALAPAEVAAGAAVAAGPSRRPCWICSRTLALRSAGSMRCTEGPAAWASCSTSATAAPRTCALLLPSAGFAKSITASAVKPSPARPARPSTGSSADTSSSLQRDGWGCMRGGMSGLSTTAQPPPTAPAKAPT